MSSEFTPFALNQVNVSHPRLSNSGSKQSLAASEDYYSLDASSNSGDETPKKTTIRYSTPPSRLHTPAGDDAILSTEVASEQHAQTRVSPPEDTITVPPAVRFEPEAFTVRRKPVGSGSSADGWRGAMDPNATPITTPGLDDTPYIRFAIDQLTRDEEIRGTRMYAAPTTTIRAPTAEQQLQLAQRPERISPIRQPSLDRSEDPFIAGIYEEGPEYMEQQKAASAGRGFPAPAIVPARHPQRPRGPPTAATAPLAAPMVRPPNAEIMASSPRNPLPHTDAPDVFVPFQAPEGSRAYPQLRFLPGILRPVALGIFIFLMVLMLTGLMFCAIYSADDGIWAYRTFGDNRYFTFRYLPLFFGIILTIWLQEIQNAVTRIAPFLGFSSDSQRARAEAVFLPLHATQYFIPQIEYFKAGQTVVGACFSVFWLFLFTIPLLASSFNVQFFGSVSTGEWRWVAVQGVIWTTITLYIFAIIALVVLFIHLRRSTTGLKWDPRSLADLFVLLERSNFMDDYVDSETFPTQSQFRQRLWDRADRLGYWHTSRREQDIFHGIGEDGGVTRSYTVEAGRIKEKVRQESQTGNRKPSGENRRSARGVKDKDGAFSIRADIRSLAARRRYLPWFLRDSAVVAWSIIAVVLYIAFLVVSFVDNALHNGFSPDLRATSNNAGFSAANFLYSFIPALLAMLLFLFWQPIDLAYRRLEPWAQLSNFNGAEAEYSLLLDYTANFPLLVTAKAIANRHWKVAYVSFISLVNITIPILAGGMLWAQYYARQQQVRIAASPAALYALCFFLALYVVSFIALYPGRRKRALPHGCARLCEVISWCYMSRLLTDRAFARCQTKAELVTRLVGAPTHLRESGFLASVTNLMSRNGSKVKLQEKAAPATDADVKRVNLPGEVRYGFGVYVGRDGQEHLGVDRVRRAGGSDMVLFNDGRRQQKR